MWIARDKSGELYLYVIKPYRDNWCECWEVDNTPEEYNKNEIAVLLSDKLFPQFKELTWEDEPQQAYIFTEKDLEELRNSCSAISLMNYLDDNKRADKKMCLSNGECEQIDKAFAANDWTIIIKYIRKYIDIESL